MTSVAPGATSRSSVAVPVAARETCESLQRDVDDVVCAVTPEPFFAVGQSYQDFSQLTDQEVRELLQSAAEDLVESRPAR